MMIGIQVSKYPQNIKISGNGDRCLVFWPKGLPLLSTVKLFRSADREIGNGVPIGDFNCRRDCDKTFMVRLIVKKWSCVRVTVEAKAGLEREF